VQLLNINKKNTVASGYFNVPNDNISRLSASRRTIFSTTVYNEHRKVSDIPSSFEKRRIEFRTEINMNKA
jgi:hypothetical protein